MKIFSLTIIKLLVCLPLFSQADNDLKNKLDSIYALDQLYRQEVNKVMNNKHYQDSLSFSENFILSEYVKGLMLKQEEVDRSNISFVDSILQIYGYPGRSLVGDSTSIAAWHVIQHSDNIDKYFKTIRKAAKNKEISFTLFAKMLDRRLIMKGKKQIYGTQSDCIANKSGDFDCKISPTRNPKSVNKRRKKAGFENSIFL